MKTGLKKPEDNEHPFYLGGFLYNFRVLHVIFSVICAACTIQGRGFMAASHFLFPGLWYYIVTGREQGTKKKSLKTRRDKTEFPAGAAGSDRLIIIKILK